ncbi:MAG: (S)-ureidoglycine aminohydrolase [Spirochaetaceae bacterium]|nr:MAG: (S)-ureidoglycine aminohydrolase [Spirochaetaceae bacterium]
MFRTHRAAGPPSFSRRRSVNKQILTSTGETRSRVTRSHALIAADGHVNTTLQGWSGAEPVILISPQMGARFCLYLITLLSGGTSAPPLPGVERFVYVLDGELDLEFSGSTHRLALGGYAYLPPDLPHRLTVDAGRTNTARFTVVERRYIAKDGHDAPSPLVSTTDDHPGEPFLGDGNLTVRKLLPDEPGFDMAMNTMTFVPGTPLPFVETHFMEHGLVMLSGGGVYRLDDDWYPVTAGDVIWMGPYCPQWFAATGRADASYLLYKETNRDPFLFERLS